MNAGKVAVAADKSSPPVCHELACRTISHSIPHYGLRFSSCLTHDLLGNGVRHCLPQSYPNRMPCCLKTPAQTPHLVF